jgi:hypothetical protein
MAQRAAEDLGLTEHTMTPEERGVWFEKGLAERGFVGIDNACSLGKCHKDDEHFILVTDGLVIYRNYAAEFFTASEDQAIEERWDWFKFDFIQLDELMKYQEYIKNQELVRKPKK